MCKVIHTTRVIHFYSDTEYTYVCCKGGENRTARDPPTIPIAATSGLTEIASRQGRKIPIETKGKIRVLTIKQKAKAGRQSDLGKKNTLVKV